jgi:hypothetical protein
MGDREEAPVPIMDKILADLTGYGDDLDRPPGPGRQPGQFAAG